MSNKKRYVQVGIGGRARFFYEAIAEKYSPDYKEGIPEEINSSMASLCIVEITIDHLTGKEAIELVRARNNH